MRIAARAKHCTGFFVLILIIFPHFADAVLEAQEAADVAESQKETDSGKVPEGIISLAQSAYYSPFVFVVNKEKRVLTIWEKSGDKLKLVRHYPTDMGKETGDKVSLGDHKTPEGVYFFINRYEGETLDFSRYGSRAFTTDYPNYFDQRDGKTGSGIWLHAVPDKVPLTRGSRGCVVVRDDAIKEVTSYIKLKKTPIIIFDAVKYVDSDGQKKRGSEIKSLLAAWRAAWQNKELDDYMSYYSEQFISKKMNWLRWRAYKASLNKGYKNIKVKFSDANIFEHNEHITVRMLQAYESDYHADFGEKILYIKKEKNGFKILGENWTEIKDKEQKQVFTESLATEGLPPNPGKTSFGSLPTGSAAAAN